MLKIIVDRDDDTQIINITREMWNQGCVVKKYGDGIRFDFYGNNRYLSSVPSGTFIHTSKIDKSSIDEFIKNLDKHIDDNRVFIIGEFKIKTPDDDKSDKKKHMFEYIGVGCPLAYRGGLY